MKRLIYMIGVLMAGAGLLLPLAFAQNMPPDLPTANVPEMPITPPSAPNPPPVEPQLVETPAPIPPGPSTLDKAADNILDLIENPGKIRTAIEEAPKTVPKQLERVKEQVINITDDPMRFNGSNFEVLKWKNSLMFPPRELYQLYNVAKGLTDQSVGAVLVEVKVPRVAPAFYLSSVLYNTPDNWTIWLNSRRIRAGATFPELEIARVDKDFVAFIWQTDQLDFIAPEWEERVPPIPLEEGEPVPRFVYQSKDGMIAVDSSRRFVRFILGPHQTFVSKRMKIVEGFVKSTIFETVQRIATTPPGGGTEIKIEQQPAVPAAPAPAAPKP